MKDQTCPGTTAQEHLQESCEPTFHSATPRQSVGLVEPRHSSFYAGGGDEDGYLLERPTSEEDLLQFFLAIESSRQEMETYSRYLSTVAKQNSQARAEAEAKAKLRSDFLATMSHEMRTPLNGIIGMTAVLLSRSLGDLERDYIETIRQAGEALRGIVDDVLDLSKIEAGKLRLENLTFDVAKLVSDTLQIVSPMAVQKSLQLVVKHDPRVPKWVCGDDTRIRQILLNLLSNAIKFTDKGKIEVCTRVQFMDHAACELLFSVKDEGIGITEEQQRNLFQPFNQAEDSTARKYGGTGLGLAISKRLAELMGGQIGVTSRYGEGSNFWFTLVLQVAPKPVELMRPALLGSPRLLSAKAARLLLVEDNKINQKVALLMLKNLGYDADVASNGMDALLAVENTPYDLILMDCMMPEMDGFEATKRLRNQGAAYSAIPIIAMTASAFDDDRVACLSAGMNDFLSKPVTEAELEAKLEFWLTHDGVVQAAH